MADEALSPGELYGRQLALTTALLRHVGQEGQCRSCKASIVWVQHLNGKITPYDRDGQSHFATCPDADRFRHKR